MEEHAGPIVLVEDDRVVLGLMREALEDIGFSVLCLDQPRQAASQLGEVEPALFLVDIMLPEMSGIELARALRAGEFPHTPMVGMSASPFLVTTARRTEVFQEVLAKPFDLDDLLTIIHRYIH